MSEIPSGPISAGDSRAVSLLARVILPRPGEPLDVRKLYIEDSDTNSRRSHAVSRTELQIGAESEVSFATYFNAFPASYWRRWSTLNSVVLRVELTGTARVDVYRSKLDLSRLKMAAGSGSTSPPTPSRPCTARAGTRRFRHPAGPISPWGFRLSTAPPTASVPYTR